MSDPFADYDAAYVMGALDPQDRRAYEAHLSTCPQCTAAVAELAGMPGLLAQVPVQQVLAPRSRPEPLPETLLPRLVAEAKRQRRRRRTVSGVVGALVAACLAVAVALAGGAFGGHDQISATQATGLVMTSPVSSGHKPPVLATVQLERLAWGTALHVRCAYEGGKGGGGSDADEAGYTSPIYRLVVLSKASGAAEQVATWTAISGKTLKVIGSTDLLPSQIADIQLQNSRGVTLLHVVPA